MATTGYAGLGQDVLDPVGAEGAGVSHVVVEGHGPELLSGGGPRPVGQGPLQVRLDGGPVDVGDAGADDVGQVGEQPVGVAAVAVSTRSCSRRRQAEETWDGAVAGLPLSVVPADRTSLLPLVSSRSHREKALFGAAE